MRRSDPRWIRSRARLRSAALKLAADGSIDEASMGTLAEAAEVSRSTAYLHAGSPRELLEDALRTELDHVRDHRLRDIRSVELAAAGEAATRDVIAHVERHAEVYRIGLAESDGLRRLLRDHFTETIRMLLREHDVGPGTGGDRALVHQLVARSIAESTIAQIAVWIAQPAPRDVELFLAVHRRMLPAWWPGRSS